MGGSTGYLGLPTISREQFDRVQREKFRDPLCWKNDDRNPGVIDPDEIERCNDSSAKLSTYVVKRGDELRFTPAFETRYRKTLEHRRQELLKGELAKIGIVTVKTKLSDPKLKLLPQEQRMLWHIIAAGKYIEQAYHRQLGAEEFNAQARRGTPANARFVEHFQMPWCEGNEDPLCSALPTYPLERIFYPANFFDAEGKARCDLLKGVRELTNPFHAVVEDGQGGWRAVPYAEAYRDVMQPAVAELKKAAAIARDLKGEGPLATYLEKVAVALTSTGLNPFHESDQAWLDAAHQSKFYVRVGPDEQYWEECHTKAGYHVQVGIVDKEASRQLEAYRPHVTSMEAFLAGRIGGDLYTARDVQVKMPEVVDAILFAGDARGSNQTTIGQTLPNQCGPDGSVQCASNRTIIYRNHIEASYTGKTAPRIELMFSEEVRRHIDRSAHTDKTALHEFAHNLGPNGEFRIASKKGIPADEAFGPAVGYLEELKAETAALDLQSFLKEAGLYSEERVKANYTAAAMWMLGHLKKHLYAKDDLSKAKSGYAKLAAVQFGYLVGQGAFVFESQGKVWNIDYGRMPEAVAKLMREVGRIYASGDAEGLKALSEKYHKGAMLARYHLDVLEERVGSDPNVAVRYEVAR